MSLAEVMPPYEQSSRAADRTPPQDMDAEQSVLGAMLSSKDAIADVVEVLRGTDFYRPAHELVYDAILDLYGRGDPADAVTVSDELTKRGQITRVGGSGYLVDLIGSVTVVANASWYAARSCGRRPCCGAWSTPRCGSTRWATPARATST